VSDRLLEKYFTLNRLLVKYMDAEDKIAELKYQITKWADYCEYLKHALSVVDKGGGYGHLWEDGNYRSLPKQEVLDQYNKVVKK